MNRCEGTWLWKWLGRSQVPRCLTTNTLVLETLQAPRLNRRKWHSSQIKRAAARAKGIHQNSPKAQAARKLSQNATLHFTTASATAATAPHHKPGITKHHMTTLDWQDITWQDISRNQHTTYHINTGCTQRQNFKLKYYIARWSLWQSRILICKKCR